MELSIDQSFFPLLMIVESLCMDLQDKYFHRLFSKSQKHGLALKFRPLDKLLHKASVLGFDGEVIKHI